MTKAEIEAALRAAFKQCQAQGSALNDRQKLILLQVAQELTGHPSSLSVNPLDELTPDQRRALLKFIQQEDRQDRDWKVTLLNDWLNDTDSGSVQFVRDRYGPQWLDRVQTYHFDAYSELVDGEAIELQVGDRIEVCNGLWEWVQEDGPCPPEWFSCTVVGLRAADESYGNDSSCTVRFDNGREYEIQGIYQWNRYNWRWAKD
jgi:ribosomal protein S15P/S13E